MDEKLIGVELEILYSYDEPDGSTKKMWCQGIVVAELGMGFTSNGTQVPSVMVMSLLLRRLQKSKYNKHVIGGWRYSIE